MRAIQSTVSANQTTVPELTVITVCRNAESSLPRTIQSVISQRDVLLQYVVVDGASTDGTKDLLAQYRFCIDVLVSEPDRGIYDAMNKGLMRAQGQLIHFLNAGDVFSDDQVAASVIAEYRRSKPALLYGDVRVVDGKHSDGERISYRDWNLARFFEQPLCHQGLFVSQDAFRICGDFDASYRFAADQDWILRAMRQYRLECRYLPIVLADFDGGGVTSDSNPSVSQRVRSEIHTAIRHHFNILERLVYKVVRRCRIQQRTRVWSVLASVMNWNLNQ